MEGGRHQMSKQRGKGQIRFTYVEQFDVADIRVCQIERFYLSSILQVTS